MTPGFAARRGAEEFNSMVEGASTEGPGSARYDEFMELVATLRDVPAVEPRADFVADLRRQLMSEAATVLTPTAARLTVAPRRSPRERRLAVMIGGFAVVSATTSMAMASQTALPGDTLYPLKRALENASTTIQIDEDERGSSLLDHASGRLDEVNELTRQSDDPNPEAVSDTLQAFADQATSASALMIAAYADSGQESGIEELRTFAAQSMAALTELETVVPDTARAALIEAAQVLSGIDLAAFTLCPSCGPGPTEVPEFEPTSVDSDADDLSTALAAPLTEPEPGKGPGKNNPEGPTAGDDDPADDPKGVDGPDRPIDNLGPIPGESGGGNDDVDTGSEADGGSNVIDDLTDRLTGGGKAPTNNQSDLTEVLDDPLGSIVNNLFGK